MTALRRRMIEHMELRNFSPKTIQLYVQNVARFARHFGKSPDQLGPHALRTFLLYLVHERKVAWGTYKQALSALRFLYRNILQRGEVVEDIRCPRPERRLPEVLSFEEVRRFFAAVHSFKHRTILMTAYAAGLRISEAVRLRVSDIDSQRMVLRVAQGKRNKDRQTLLSPILLAALLRRFLLHVLPDGLVRIRHYGFLANRFRQQKLERCRTLLGLSAPVPLPDPQPDHDSPAAEQTAEASCPECGQAALRIILMLHPAHGLVRGPARLRRVEERCNSP